MSLQDLHRQLSVAPVLYMLAVGLLGLVYDLRHKTVTPDYLGMLAIGELLLIAEGLLGVVLLLSGQSPGRVIHILYGILAVISIPSAFAFLQGREDRQALRVYWLVGLFLMGVSLRAIYTAKGG